MKSLQKILKELGLREKVDYTMFINGKEMIFDRANAKENLDKHLGN